MSKKSKGKNDDTSTLVKFDITKPSVGLTSVLSFVNLGFWFEPKMKP